MEKTITFIGLDVHKKSLSVAVADGGVGGEVRFAGTISNTAGALTKLADRLARKGGVLSFCYEAGPCGYGVYRHLRGTDGACGSDPAKKRASNQPAFRMGLPRYRPQAARPLAAAFRSGLTSARTCQSQSRARRKALVCRCRRSFPKAPRALPIPPFANRGAPAPAAPALRHMQGLGMPYIWAENPGNDFGGLSVAKSSKNQ